VENFFNSNFSNFPPKINNKNIDVFRYDYNDVLTKISSEITEKKTERFKNLKPRKSEDTLIHDLILTDVVLKYRAQNDKLIVLTKDSFIYEYLLSNKKRSDKLPAWIHLKAILGIVSSAIPYKESFSKIFRRMIQDSCSLQGDEGFNINDISYWLEGAHSISLKECSKINECIDLIRHHRLNINNPGSSELRRNLEDIISNKKEANIEEMKRSYERVIANKDKEINEKNSILKNNSIAYSKIKCVFKYLLFFILLLVLSFLLVKKLFLMFPEKKDTIIGVSVPVFFGIAGFLIKYFISAFGRIKNK